MNKLMMLILFLPTFILIASEITDERILVLPSDDIQKCNIDCGAGFLKIEGVQEGSSIEVKASITISSISDDDFDNFLKKHLELTLEKRGRSAYLKADFKHGSGIWNFITQGAGKQVIDLTVKVPKGINLEISDGSGFIDINNIDGDLEVIDGSGSIHIRDIQGDVELNDGSGSIEIGNVTGNLEIDDGSGELEIERIYGSVTIEDGAGSSILKKIEGNIFIDDGAGEITITGVKGDVKLSDGSGSIRITDVTDNVTILESGSGSVDIAKVQGSIIRKDN
jgi:hypothetical protein